MNDRLAQLTARLQAAGQAHLLDDIDALSPERREAYLAQLEHLDLALVEKLCRLHLHEEPEPIDPTAVEPIDVVPHPERPEDDAEALLQGRAALEAGEVAVVMVAGGQGSRLGYNRAKGCYPIGPISGKSLFGLHAERVLATGLRYGRPVPYYIMTSPATHEETVAFFAEHDHFGLDTEQVTFFGQDVWPAVDPEGRIIRAGQDGLYVSPNGHGGTLPALRDNGCIDDMHQRGVTTVFYHQVDNPLVKVCDPWYIGHHLSAGAEFSCKVIEKDGPDDKLGNVCRYRDKPGIIEYSELPPQLARRRHPDGRLWLSAGSIAIHVFALDFLGQVADGTLEMPVHAARKKVPFDAAGNPVDPDEPNGIKFEMFIFDALPLARRCVVAETLRREEYAALKNRTGDLSPEHVKQCISNVGADWLREAGAEVPLDADGNAAVTLEISPLYALDPQQLAEKLPAEMRIEQDLYLE